MNQPGIKVGLVGVCGSGKTTLTNLLKPLGYHVRQIAQEHSYVPDMWQRLAKPDVLIYLQASYPVTLQRKPFRWSEKEYNEQLWRLRHANQYADLHLNTDNLTPEEVFAHVLAFLENKTQNISDPSGCLGAEPH